MNVKNTDSEDTLSASEDEQSYEEMPMTETVYRERKADLEHATQLLELGHLAAYSKRLRELEQQKQQALEDALGAKLREQAWIDREYQRELQAAEEELQRNKRALLAMQLEELEKLKEQYQYEFVNGRPDDDRATEMGLFLDRRRRMQAKKDAATAKSSSTTSQLVFKLSKSEIGEDLAAIGGASCAAASSGAGSSSSTEQQKEQPKPTWSNFQEGMVVTVIGQRMSPIVGTIVTKQGSELNILKANGNMVNVPRAHLAHGGLRVIPRSDVP